MKCRTAFLEIYNEINKKDKDYTLRTANALWAQKDYPLLTEYFELINKYYDGKITNLHFSKPGYVCKTINGWFAEWQKRQQLQQ